MIESRGVVRLKMYEEGVYRPDGVLMNCAGCVYVFAKCREILEAENKQSQYPMIYFFSNWILHTSISKTGAIKFFINFLEVFSDFKKTGNRGAVNDRVNDVISFKELRKELIQLFESNGLKTLIFRQRDSWHEFVMLMAPEIAFKPFKIVSPTKKDHENYKKRFQEFSERQLLHGLNFVSFQLAGINGQLRWQLEELDPKRGIVIHEGTVMKTEPDGAFDPATHEIVREY